MQDWQRIAAIADLEADRPLGARIGDQDIVLVAHEGRVHALAGICPHAYALMCDGFLDGPVIECPLHAAAFDIRTGKLIEGPPGTHDLAVHEAKVEAGEVWVRLGG